MTFGISACAVSTHCMDANGSCGGKNDAQSDNRICALMGGAFLFDVMAVLALVTVGALVLRGGIKLSTKAGVGLLVGAGGIVLMDVLGSILARCLKIHDDRSQEQREQAGTGSEY